jgi:helicase
MRSLYGIIAGANGAALGGTQLRFAERDASVLYDGLGSQRLYDSVKVYSHIGKYAAEELSESVSRTADSTGADDAVMFFFAGHGVREVNESGEQQLWLSAGLQTRDTVTGSAVLLPEIIDTLSQSQAKCVVILLDCCFSGLHGGRSVLGPRMLSMLADGRPLVQLATPPLSGEGRVVLAASRHDQEARETGIHRHGMFSYALLEHLGQWERADSVDVASLYVEVRRMVLRLTNGAQCPTLFGGDQGAELPTLRLRSPG